ncbi:MAG: ubiquinone biosynthesis monooxygenase Coq7 [Marteilia pararefringens]
MTEKKHLKTFDYLAKKYTIQTSILEPFWDLSSFSLGAFSALLGKNFAMATTYAIEDAIVEHYNKQLRDLLVAAKQLNSTSNHSDSKNDPKNNENIPKCDINSELKNLMNLIKDIRDEENDHKQVALKSDTLATPFLSAYLSAIKRLCSSAIWLSERM